MSNQWQKEVNSRQSDQQEELLDISEDKKIRTVADLEKDAEAARKERILAEQKKATEKEDDEDYIPPLSQSQEPKTSTKPEELKEYSEMVAQQLQVKIDGATTRFITNKYRQTSSAPTSFLGLPEELIKKSLEGLTPKEIAKLGLVSKDTERVSTDPELWRSFLRKDTGSKNPKSDYGNEKKLFERADQHWPNSSYYFDKSSKLNLSLEYKHRNDLPKLVENFLKKKTALNLANIRKKLQNIIKRKTVPSLFTLQKRHPQDFNCMIDWIEQGPTNYTKKMDAISYPPLRSSLERSSKDSKLYKHLYDNYDQYHDEFMSLGIFFEREKKAILHNLAKYQPTIEIVKFFAAVLTNYPDDRLAPIKLASHLLCAPQEYEAVRYFISGTHNNVHDCVKELFSRLFNVSTDDITLAKTYYNIGTTILHNPKIRTEHFERTPALWQLFQKLRRQDSEASNQPDEQKLDHSSISVNDLALAALHGAAELGFYLAKIRIAGYRAEADSNKKAETILQNMAQEVQKIWLASDPQQYLINVSKHEQDYAFFDFCYHFFRLAAGSYKKAEAYFYEQIKKTQEDAINSISNRPIPKWLNIILKVKNEQGLFEPKYVIDGLYKRLGIKAMSLLDDDEVCQLYYKLAKNIVHEQEKIKTQTSPEEEDQLSEDDRLLLAATPHVNLLLSESEKLGNEETRALHKIFLNSYVLTEQALEKKLPIRSGQRLQSSSTSYSSTAAPTSPTATEDAKEIRRQHGTYIERQHNKWLRDLDNARPETQAELLKTEIRAHKEALKTGAKLLTINDIKPRSEVDDQDPAVLYLSYLQEAEQVLFNCLNKSQPVPEEDGILVVEGFKAKDAFELEQMTDKVPPRRLSFVSSTTTTVIPPVLPGNDKVEAQRLLNS